MAASATPTHAVRPIAVKNKTKLIKLIKAWCWRGTASFLWAEALLHVAVGRGTYIGWSENPIARWTVTKLSAVGFAPTTVHHTALATFAIWILVITGLNLIHVVAFFFYLVFFPLVLIYIIWFREVRKTVEADDSERQRNARNKITRSSLIALLLWYLLYANALSRGPWILGSLIVGALLLSLTARAFSRTNPAGGYEVQTLRSIQRAGLAAVKTLAEDMARGRLQTKNDCLIRYKLHSPIRWFYSQTACYVRGRRGQSRAYLSILVEYVTSLLFLGGSAVLFWAFIERPVSLPVPRPFGDFMRCSASFFLIGVSAPAGMPVLPAWCQIGPAVTAWVLFVLYVGPAAAQLPSRQQAYAKAFSDSYPLLRRVGSTYGKLQHILYKSSR